MARYSLLRGVFTRPSQEQLRRHCEHHFNHTVHRLIVFLRGLSELVDVEVSPRKGVLLRRVKARDFR